ncbi:MAG: SprB repeat-containing protein [Bacteroidetes bacterium]|nr:SprB repeat-containing protein [Bacteroidota bacterium]
MNVTLTPSNYNGNNISCFGAQDGSINAVVSGGIPPYTYSWSNGFNSPNAIELPAGYYRLTVRDAALNTVISEITLTEPEQLNYELQVYEYPNGYNVSCHSCYNGSATVTIYGGTPPYTALWDDGNTNINRTSLGAGAIEAELTDLNGCHVNITRTDISQPERSDWTMLGNSNANPSINFIGTIDNKDFNVRTNNIERLKIAADGNLILSNLIGKSGPLIVDQNGKVGSGNADGFLAPCNNPVAFWQGLTNPLTVFTCLPVKVGIGTYQPQSLVDIKGGITIGENYAGVNAAPNNGMIVEGNVGIGVSSVDPSIKLTVTSANDALVWIGSTNTQGATAGLILKSGPNGWYSLKVNALGEGSINVEPSNTAILTFNMNGNVGIGTLPQDNPQYRLVVDGKIGAREINVKASGVWPDYVFHPDYKLMPIKELQAYLNTNHHLPHIPSAAEITTTGSYDVGKMQQLHLLTTEELYRYVFELMERVEKLEKNSGR